ncbi:MAG: type VI secretion system protein TssL, long form [Burkholderiales bacterium]
MSERPRDGADPDATVVLPAAKADDDATVMIPAPKVNDDATVMIPAAKADDDATVMMPAPAPAVDADATVMIPPAAAAEPDPDATIAIPTPGRKRDAGAPALPAAPAAGSEAASIDIGAMGGLNPLVAAANPILAIAAQIRHALKHPDPDGLRMTLARGVVAFEQAARDAGAAEDTIAAASAALSALAYESAASTPWGAAWSSGDGTSFFDALERYGTDPAANRDLLEFFYVCLALGYEGRYRGVPDGRQALADVRAGLLERLRPLRPARDGELSAHWRGLAAPARRPAGGIGLWAAGCAAALLLAALYTAYSISLGGSSDPVAKELAQLKAVPAPEKPRAAIAASATPRIAEQLAAEIARGEIAVADAAGMSTIVVRSDRLFASGSARLEPAIEPAVLRIAEALDRVPGTIVVTGHTDDVPIRTARFPSNWELSTERASSVVKLMAGKLQEPARLKAEGLADSAPAAANDSAANRARNRRVEIILRSAQ